MQATLASQVEATQPVVSQVEDTREPDLLLRDDEKPKKIRFPYFTIEETLRMFLQDRQVCPSFLPFASLSFFHSLLVSSRLLKFLESCPCVPLPKELVEDFMDSPFFNHPDEVSILSLPFHHVVLYFHFRSLSLCPHSRRFSFPSFFH